MRGSKALRFLRPPEPMGHLVDSTSPPVLTVRTSPSNQFEETYSGRSKFSPLTIQGQSPNPGMARVPPSIGKTINTWTQDWTPQQIRKRAAELYHDLGNGGAHGPALEKLDVDAQITGTFLQNYVSLVSTLRDLKKRRPDFNPQSILDIGFGPATGLLAAREVFGAGQETDGEPSEARVRETAVIIGHPRMKRRAKELLGDKSRVLFRDDVPSINSPKRFDLIIATHQLFQHGHLAEELVDSHSQHLGQILGQNGIVLFLERGDPLGFEAVASAREHMLRPKYGFNVVGPCQHNLACPLQVGLKNRLAATNAGRENWCRFSQNVERPRFSKELKKGQYLAQEWLPEESRGGGGKSLKGKGRPGGNSNEIAHYSWVALENAKPNASAGPSAEWPRIMKQPQKRHGHVTMEVCAPSGRIEHWTIPRSQGKQEYHDARKANASDLWALDAKVKQVRGGIRGSIKPTGKTAVPKIEAAGTATASTEKSSKLNPRGLELAKDWWKPSSNPFYKFSSHQARIHSENTAMPEEDGFIPVMEALLAEESKAERLSHKTAHKRRR